VLDTGAAHLASVIGVAAGVGVATVAVGAGVGMVSVGLCVGGLCTGDVAQPVIRAMTSAAITATA
jgi:hypothetical protein